MPASPLFFRTVLSLALLLALAACAVGPDYQRPDPAARLPAAYHGEAASPRSAPLNWWTVFDDPALDAAVDRALQASQDAAAAEARVRQARASLGVVDSALWPQLNAGGRVGRDQLSRNSENFANMPLPHPQTGFTDYRVGLDASWELDLFGHARRQSEAAGARLGGAQAQQADALLRVAAETARNVIDFRGWSARLVNAETMATDSRENLRLIQLQQAAGLVSDNEVSQARAAADNAAAQLPPLRAARGAALNALSVLLDEPLDKVSARFAASRPMPAVLAEAPVGLPADLLRRRPDIRLAERNLAAASADVGVAVAEQYPRLTLVGSGGWDSIHPGSLTEAASRFWNVGPQLSLPLFNAGRLHNQVKANEAARDLALANYRQSVLTALADVETTLLRYGEENRREAALAASLRESERQTALAEQRVRAGESAQTDTLASRQLQAQAREQWLASRQAQAANLVALFKALGGGAQVEGKEASAAR